MAKNKLQKFKELNELANVAQVNQTDAKAKLEEFLGEKTHIILELACGKGEYSLALADIYNHYKIVGVDIQGERLWHGAKYALKNKLDNVFFLRIQIEDLNKYFNENIIDEIWITFPDPFPREKQIKKRLSSPRFLKIYKSILKNNSTVNLKTDDYNLYKYSMETIVKEGGKILENIEDIYSAKNIKDVLRIQTDFEKKHLQNNKKIYYLQFSL